jgi:hypothetical protein
MQLIFLFHIKSDVHFSEEVKRLIDLHMHLKSSLETNGPNLTKTYWCGLYEQYQTIVILV